MENAVEAFKMAGFILLFVIALSIAMITLTQAKTTADSIVQMKNKQESYQYIELAAGERNLSRTVTLADIIPTLYRYASEEYAVIFYKNSSSTADTNQLPLYESGRPGNPMRGDLDLDTEHWVDASGETKYEAWRGDTTKIKQHVDEVVQKLLKDYNNATFTEKLGTEEVLEEDNNLVPDINKQYKRIITYTLN